MVTSGNSKLSIPTFIPLAEAARKYDLTEDVLTRLIQDGRIEAAQLPSGDLLVSDEGLNEKTKEQIIEEKFGHLRGRPITIKRATEKYHVPRTTLLGWIDLEYIRVVDSTYRPKKIDEAEVAYCSEIYHQRKKNGIRTGAPLLDENGLPYQLKHPELSVYRRQRKKKQKAQ